MPATVSGTKTEVVTMARLVKRTTITETFEADDDEDLVVEDADDDEEPGDEPSEEAPRRRSRKR